MRIKIPVSIVFGLMICMASAFTAASQASEENRYKGWIEENIFYRFDNQTGEIFKLVKPAAGPAMWMKCDIAEPKAQPAAAQLHTQPLPVLTASAQISARPQPAAIIESDIMPAINTERSAAKPAANRQIEVWNEFGKNITNEIDDADRAACRSTINGYDALHVSHTLKTTGDRIKGIVILDNKGARKIAMMELTMTVRVIGKDKPIAHRRFIFDDKASGEKPPVPSFGSSGMSVLKTVDIPTPSGVINGMPEITVTYIRFDDKE